MAPSGRVNSSYETHVRVMRATHQWKSYSEEYKRMTRRVVYTYIHLCGNNWEKPREKITIKTYMYMYTYTYTYTYKREKKKIQKPWRILRRVISISNASTHPTHDKFLPLLPLFTILFSPCISFPINSLWIFAIPCVTISQFILMKCPVCLDIHILNLFSLFAQLLLEGFAIYTKGLTTNKKKKIYTPM